MMQFLTYCVSIYALVEAYSETELFNDQYSIHLRIEKTKQNGKLSCVVNCGAEAKPFDNSAEFIVDNISKENIGIADGICFNMEKKQCNPNYCTCSPDLKAFTVNFTMTSLNVGQVFACQMRFLDTETGDIIKVYNSRRFNGTDFLQKEYDMKIIFKEKNDIKHVNETRDGTNLPDSGNRLNVQVIIWSVFASVCVGIAISVCLRIRKYRKDKSPTLNPDNDLSGLYKECDTCPSMAIWGFCYSCALCFCTMCSDFHVVVNHEHIILKIEESGIGRGKTIKCEMCYNLKSIRVCTKCSILLCKNCNCIHSNVPTGVKLLKQNIIKTYKCNGKNGFMNISGVKAQLSLRWSNSLNQHWPNMCGISFFDRNNIVAVDSKNESILILKNENENNPLEYQIGYKPNGVVRMSFSEVAVSCSYKRQIDIFDFSTQKSKFKRSIDMQLIGQPFNISYNEEHFVVEIGNFDNGFIVVIDRNAKEIARIEDLDGITKCTGHSIRLALDMKSKHIFLAAAMKMSVSSIDFEGHILWLIAIPSPSDLIFVPHLLSYGRNILLASEKTNTVLFVNASDGCFEDYISFNGPRHIAFDSIDNLLAVYNKSGSINIYELGKTSTEIEIRDF